MTSPLRRSLALAALSAATACAPPPPATPPPPQALPPASALAPTAPPPASAQVFSPTPTEYAFADPERRAKLASAFAAVDALAAAEIADHGPPSLALGVIVDGELVHAKGVGFTNLDAKTAPDADTVYRIGSMTKSFTALAILALRDDGVLTLDDPLTRWLPEASGLVYLSRDAAPITLRQLLNHTSGLPRLGNFDYIFDDREPSEDVVLKSLAGFALLNAPGMKHVYSNLGFTLLGLVVGRAAHVPLRAFIASRLFKPLGMASSAFDPAGLPAARLATAYDKSPLDVIKPATTWRLGASEGAGGIYSTVRDMARYLALQMAAYPPRDAADDGPIRRSTLREAHLTGVRANRLRVALREAPAKGESLVVAASRSYGNGWLREDDCDLDDVIWHNGAVDGFSSAMSFLPERGVGVVALTNGVWADPASFVTKVLAALNKTGGLAPRVRKPVLPPAFAPALARFLGVYDAWSEAGYHAMLTRNQPVVMDDERKEIAGLRELHGRCTGYTTVSVSAPRDARLALQCERGKLELLLQLDGDLIAGFQGTSTEVPAPPAASRAAERLTGLIRKWDDGAYRALFGARPAEHRVAKKSFFDGLHTARGACSVKTYTHTGGSHEFALACERGGDLHLAATLDPKDDARVTSLSFKPAGDSGACPVK